MNMKRGRFLKNSVAFVCIIVSVSCLLVVIISVLKLPDVSLGNSAIHSLRTTKFKRGPKEERIGKFGEMMVEMLPEDLAFTIFIPSEKAFERDLRLRMNDSLVAERANDTYAILTRILGFSTVPRMIYSDSVPFGKMISYDSLSGFGLYISKDLDGMLVVNRVPSVRVDFRKGEIVVHIMNGVIMDSEFEQSVQPDYNEED
uniref:FAS1 domain-containing protein n=1 Tax=Davidia involucrata TaxID=16924 RepID=A0A5B7BNU9_DAVIN